MYSNTVLLCVALSVSFGLSKALNFGERLELAKNVCSSIEVSECDAIVCQIIFGRADEYPEPPAQGKWWYAGFSAKLHRETHP